MKNKSVLDFKHRYRKWNDEMMDPLDRLYRYFQQQDLDFDFGDVRLQTLKPLTWSSEDCLKIALLCGLSSEFIDALRQGELYDPQNLSEESPLRFLDEEDLGIVLEESAPSFPNERNIFLAAHVYLKSSCCSKSCSRKA